MLALAATWPNRAVLVEADPFGGVIAARYGLGDSPGLSSLTAAARRGFTSEQVRQHVQQLPGGTPVLVGPVSADQAHTVLRDAGPALAAWQATEPEVGVIVDCGRLVPGAPTQGALAVADVVLVAARPTLDQLRPAAHRLNSLDAAGVEAGLLLVGDEPYGPDEVASALGVPVAAVIAWDPRAAALLSGTARSVRDLRRSPLVRSAAALAVDLAPPLSPTVVPEDFEAVSSGGDAWWGTA